MAPRLAPAVSTLARQTMSTAFDELEKTVTPADARDFRSASLEAVRRAALEVQKRMEAKQLLRNMRRLKPLFDGMEHYAKVIDILCNGTPFLPWIWAPMTLILRVASEYVEAFELLMKGYDRIASNLGRFEKLGHEFLTNQDFQHTLAIYYANILQFHKYAYKFVRRNGWRRLFVTSWGRFQRRFDNIYEDLKKHGELIDAEANAQNIVEAGRMRKEIRQWREDSLVQVEREEEERAASQFRSVLSWLKIDEFEQLSICEAIFEEGTKYPGTCSWVTAHPKISPWLQQRPESPVVWLQGNPGTGKSIAAGQIVKFIGNSHAFVIRHFCSYSHIASTKYENIVKSLLSQLVRRNGELLAHVYQDCILNKKAPTITLLEQLVCTLCTSFTDEPGKVRYLWIVMDGLDECEQNKQSRLLTLMNQITSKSASEGATVCKVLISSRPSSTFNKYLRKKSVVSLSDEREQMHKSIEIYASQRLLSTIKRLRQLDIEREDIEELAKNIATKAHGMFLYARLVLDYVTSNIFYSLKEIKESINQLPPSLTEFYQKILIQMVKGLDSRSVDRVKTVLGWVAFAKRPLKKLELLSAVSFGQGDPEIDRLVPPYLLDICGPLMEEKRDATLTFIHVSVKEFLQSSQGRISISERPAMREHATATIAALLAGLRIFHENFDERVRMLQLVRGVHGLHVYATEFWIECLMNDAQITNGLDTSSGLFAMASELAQQLSAVRIEPLPKELTLHSSEVDDRLELFKQHSILYDMMKAALNARSRKRLETELLRPQDSEQSTGHPPVLDAVSRMLQSYQQAVELLLNEDSHPGVSAEELENFKSQFKASIFTCRLRSCPRATIGFENASVRREHEITHAGGYRCTAINCTYPPFPSANSLKSHVTRVHNPNPAPKSIRRVGVLNGLIKPSSSEKINEKEFISVDMSAKSQAVSGTEVQRKIRADLLSMPVLNPSVVKQGVNPASQQRGLESMLATSQVRNLHRTSGESAIDVVANDLLYDPDNRQFLTQAQINAVEQLKQHVQEHTDAHALSTRMPQTETAIERFIEEESPWHSMRATDLETTSEEELGYLVLQLDPVFQNKQFEPARERLERILTELKMLPMTLSVEDRAAYVPPDVAPHIKERLVSVPQSQFIRVLEKACERARHMSQSKINTHDPLVQKYLDLSDSDRSKRNPNDPILTQYDLSPEFEAASSSGETHPNNNLYLFPHLPGDPTPAAIPSASLVRALPGIRKTPPPENFKLAPLLFEESKPKDSNDDLFKTSESVEMERGNGNMIADFNRFNEEDYPSDPGAPAPLRQLAPPEGAVAFIDQEKLPAYGKANLDCDRCRKMAFTCDRSLPICQLCDLENVNCQYLAPDVRQTYNQDCDRCRRRGLTCDRFLPLCQLCFLEDVHCKYPAPDVQTSSQLASLNKPPSGGDESVNGSLLQLGLIEKENKKRLLRARQEQEKLESSQAPSGYKSINNSLHQLMLMEQENKKRLLRARQEQEKLESSQAPSGYKSSTDSLPQLILMEQENRKRLEKLESSQAPSGYKSSTDSLPQLMLMEQENRQRLLRARQEQEKLESSQAQRKMTKDDQKSMDSAVRPTNAPLAARHRHQILMQQRQQQQVMVQQRQHQQTLPFGSEGKGVSQQHAPQTMPLTAGNIKLPAFSNSLEYPPGQVKQSQGDTAAQGQQAIPQHILTNPWKRQPIDAEGKPEAPSQLSRTIVPQKPQSPKDCSYKGDPNKSISNSGRDTTTMGLPTHEVIDLVSEDEVENDNLMWQWTDKLLR